MEPCVLSVLYVIPHGAWPLFVGELFYPVVKTDGGFRVQGILGVNIVIDIMASETLAIVVRTQVLRVTLRFVAP